MPDVTPQGDVAQNIPSTPTSIRDMYAQVKADAEDADAADVTVDADDDEGGDEGTVETPADEGDDAAAGDDDADSGDEDADADADADDSDDTPTEGEEPEKTVAEQVLELMKDKKTLQAALESANVEDIMELPIVKELLGRERQSAADTTKAEIQRQQFEDTQVNARLEQGRKTIDDFVSEMEALAKAIEEDEDGTAELVVPTPDTIRENFKKVADASVEAYHAQTFADIAEVIYALPELNAAPDELKAELAKFAGRPPQEWLGAHLEAARQTLWNIAQNQVAANAEKRIEDQKTLLEAAHKAEIEKLVAKHEKALAKAVEEAKKNARAEAIADAASGKLPPKSPKKTPESNIDEDEITGSTVGDIFKQVKRQMEKSGAL